MDYGFDFTPDFWQDEWSDDQTFTVEYEYEKGDPDVGLDESFGWVVKSNGKDVTSELNAENLAQLERDIHEHFSSLGNDYDGPDETQEWHDFDPDC